MAKQRVLRDIPGIFGRTGKPDAVYKAGDILDDAEPAGARAKAVSPATSMTPAP